MWRNPVTWLFIAIALVLGLAVWHNVNKLPDKNSNQAINKLAGPTKSASEVSIFPSDPVSGSVKAEVTIVEFGDFECTYCSQVAVSLVKVMNDYPGRIKLVWKDFPLPAHANAQAAAEAGQCAARQGQFWQYHDALFQNQANLNETTYLTLAGQLGLDFDKFSQCLQKHEVLPLIELNINEGKAIGVDGTPYFVINGQPASGILTEEQLRSLVE